MPRPSDAADKFMLRMPDGMRQRVARLAEAERRSMNAQIVMFIERGFADLDRETKTAGEHEAQPAV